MKIKKILFPTEFSSNAPDFFRYAGELAYFFKAKLILMHAFNEPEVKLLTRGEIDEKAAAAHEKLSTFFQDNALEHFSDLKIEYIVRSGFAAQEILTVSKAENVDLLVVGKRGKTNVLDKFFGTNTLELISKSVCPLLVIPGNITFEGIDQMAFTTNFEFRDFAGLNYIKTWANTFEASIHCIHVTENDKTLNEANRNMNTLKTVFSKSKNMVFEILRGRIEEAVKQYSKQKRIDVLVMQSHKRSFINSLLEMSTTKIISYDLNTPILILRLKTEGV